MEKKKIFSDLIGGLLTCALFAASGFCFGYYLGSKQEREKIEGEKETADDLAKMKEDKLKKENEDLKEQLKESQEVAEAMDILNKHVKKVQNMEFDRPIETVEDYPMDEKSIMEHNEVFDMYGFLSFTTEEEMDNLYPEYDKVHAALYSDGKLADRDTGRYLEPIDEHVGNLISGMGMDDPVRYIHNESLEMDIEVTYIDHEADLPIYDDEEDDVS